MTRDDFSKNLKNRIEKLEEQVKLFETIDNELTQGINLYRFMVEGSHIGIFIIDDDYQIVYGNNELVNIMGYPLNEIIGRDFRDFISPDSEAAASERYSRRQKGEILPHRYEVKARRPDGSEKTVEVSVAVTKSFADRVLSVVQVFDVTERKQMEAELEKSRKKYHDIFQTVFDVIFIHDLEGVFLETNASYVIEMGGTKDILVGCNVKEFMPERYWDGVGEYLAKIQKDGKAEGLLTVEIPGGEKRALEYKSILLYSPDGTPNGVCGSARDITEHIRDKQALAASEEKYRTIIEDIEDNYFELDLAGNMLFCNEALATNLGYTLDETIDMHYRTYIHPDDYEIATRLFVNIYKTGKIGARLNYRAVKEDGTVMYIESTCTLIKNDKGKPIGYRGISRDITERKRAEHNLLKMHNALEDKVRERTQGLEEANIALKVLLKKRDEDRKDLEDQMLTNIREIILPYIERLKTTPLKENQKIYLEIIESNLLDIASPFMKGLSSTFHKLTPSEIQIINLIKQDKTSKEISDFLNISPRTVEFHRDNIRKKTGD